MLRNVETEKWLILAGFVLAWLIPVLALSGSPRPTALGLPVWFLWVLLFVIIEYALVYRLGSHYLHERNADTVSGGE